MGHVKSEKAEELQAAKQFRKLLAPRYYECARFFSQLTHKEAGGPAKVGHVLHENVLDAWISVRVSHQSMQDLIGFIRGMKPTSKEARVAAVGPLYQYTGSFGFNHINFPLVGIARHFR